MQPSSRPARRSPGEGAFRLPQFRPLPSGDLAAQSSFGGETVLAEPGQSLLHIGDKVAGIFEPDR